MNGGWKVKMLQRFTMAAMVLLLLLLAACSGGGGGAGGSDAQGEPNATQSPKNEPEPSNEPKSVTLKMIMWTNPPTVEVVNKINERFMQKYPHIKIEMTDVPSNNYNALQDTRLAAKDVDLMANNAIAGRPQPWADGYRKPRLIEWIEAGTLTELTGQPVLQRYNPQAVEDACTYNGKVYCVPTGAVPFTGVFYNKDIFAQYGLSVPKTWAELEQIAETLKNNNQLVMTLAGKDGWPIALPSEAIVGSLFPDMVETNRKLWTGEMKFTDPEAKLYWERLQKLMHMFEPNWQGIDYNTVVARFASGSVAMLPDGVWQAPSILKTNPSINMGYFPLPASDDPANNESLQGKYDLSWFIPSSSPNKEEALLWLEFFSEEQNYIEYADATGFIPVQDVQVSNAFVNTEIMPQMGKFKLAQETLWMTPRDAGKYAGFTPDHIAPKGEIQTVDEMAQLSQQDWDAAIANLKK